MPANASHDLSALVPVADVVEDALMRLSAYSKPNAGRVPTPAVELANRRNGDLSRGHFEPLAMIRGEAILVVIVVNQGRIAVGTRREMAVVGGASYRGRMGITSGFRLYNSGLRYAGERCMRDSAPIDTVLSASRSPRPDSVPSRSGRKS